MSLSAVLGSQGIVVKCTAAIFFSVRWITEGEGVGLLQTLG